MLTKAGAPAESLHDDAKRSGTEGAPSPARPAAAAVSIEGVGHSFGPVRALAGLEARAAAGEVLGLVGPSGCGKSTLLELVAGLREPSEGRISIGVASAPAERLRACAYMPQRDLLLPWLRAIDNAALALRIAGRSRSEARRLAAPLLERFGLGGFELARPDELSGGMRQRIAFLRTLLAGRPILLLDEPFASLDAITRAEMQAWLAEVLRGDPHTVLLVTHDVEEALYLSDRVLVLTPRPGRVATELRVPSPRVADRAGAVTSGEFAELRARALRMLTGEAR
jgi:ABC-type nitrate/sulfonate/bicarbonate transport system ATPase subunit